MLTITNAKIDCLGLHHWKYGTENYPIKTNTKLCSYRPAIKENWLTVCLIFVPIYVHFSVLSPWRRSLSRYDLFVSRIAQTYLTTNLTGSELEQCYGNRVRSRLREMFNMVAFDKNSKDKR